MEPIKVQRYNMEVSYEAWPEGFVQHIPSASGGWVEWEDYYRAVVYAQQMQDSLRALVAYYEQNPSP